MPAVDQWYMQPGSINIGMCLAESECSKSSILLPFLIRYLEVILTIRTWAVWGRSRKIAIFLSIFFAAIWIPGFVIMGFWEATVECESILCHAQLTVDQTCLSRCSSASRDGTKWMLPSGDEFVILSQLHSDRDL